MTKLTRRKFFKGASIGAAAIGTLAIAPGAASSVLAADNDAPTKSFEELLADPNFKEQLVLHIDPENHRMMLIYGDQEVTYNDAEMVGRLLKAVRTSSMA